MALQKLKCIREKSWHDLGNELQNYLIRIKHISYD